MILAHIRGVAGDRSVDPSATVKQDNHDSFEKLPEADAIQNGIEEIRQHTIVRILGIGVVMSVVARRLNETKTLKQGNDGTVFCARAMGPFVNLVRVDA